MLRWGSRCFGSGLNYLGTSWSGEVGYFLGHDGGSLYVTRHHLMTISSCYSSNCFSQLFYLRSFILPRSRFQLGWSNPHLSALLEHTWCRCWWQGYWRCRVWCLFADYLHFSSLNLSFLREPFDSLRWVAWIWSILLFNRYYFPNFLNSFLNSLIGSRWALFCRWRKSQKPCLIINLISHQNLSDCGIHDFFGCLECILLSFLFLEIFSWMFLSLSFDWFGDWGS